jgi:hypothetical protein
MLSNKKLLSERFEEFLTYKAATVRNTLKNYQALFGQFLEVNGDMKLEDYTMDHILAYQVSFYRFD